MKTTLRFAIIAVLAFFLTSSVIAQEWTKEQKEVWQTVENTWSKWKANDVAGAAANLHEKGKNVEFYVKEGGKWLLLGDMTVNDMKDMMKDM